MSFLHTKVKSKSNVKSNVGFLFFRYNYFFHESNELLVTFGPKVINYFFLVTLKACLMRICDRFVPHWEFIGKAHLLTQVIFFAQRYNPL